MGGPVPFDALGLVRARNAVSWRIVGFRTTDRRRAVFVDVRSDALKLDETRIEAALTPRTRAICPVHHAGVAADMDAIGTIAATALLVIEDAAQGFGQAWRGRKLATLGTISSHETKNVISGEGGALVINDAALVEAAERVWEKGPTARGAAVARSTARRESTFCSNLARFGSGPSKPTLLAVTSNMSELLPS